jgi:hypothetical protein
MHVVGAMKTLLIRGNEEPPRELREIIEAGSTEVEERTEMSQAARQAADRVVIWNGKQVVLDDRRLQWPEDRDELRMLFQSGG